MDFFLSSQERRTCKTHPKIQGASRAPGETTSMTKKDTASQMAAATFLDTISKLLGMAVETSDALSAYTQVKMTEAPRL